MAAKGFLTLLQKEFLLELRQPYALQGLILYIISTIFICYLSFNMVSLQPFTWNALFWIIMLFSAVSAIAKSFMQEREERMIYYYTVAPPGAIILAKIIYNMLLMLVLTLIAYLIYSFVLGNQVKDQLYFLLAMVLGAIGFSVSLTMISSLAARATQNGSLMAILGFPVMLPIILMIMKLSKNAVDGLARSQSTDEIFTLLAIDAIVLSVSYLLFPYVWRS